MRRRDKVRSEIANVALQSPDPQKASRRLAQKFGVGAAAAWDWTYKEAQARAAERIPERGLMTVLLDRRKRARLVREMKADRTLTLVNRLHDVLPRARVSKAAIGALIAQLPAKGTLDDYFENVLYNPSASKKLLLKLARGGRFLMVLGHRAGPRELLEEIVDRYSYEEAIVTLALYHYGKEDYPFDKFIAFVRKHRNQFMLRGAIRQTKSLSARRKNAAIVELKKR